VWSFPGAPVQIHLYFEVVHGIRQYLQQTSAAGPSVSAKGLLLGKIVMPGLPEISGFQPLSGNPGELEEAIAFFKNSGSDLLPLGYFRIHAEEHLALTPEDISLAQTFFSDPNSVFLLIQPSETGPANAGFFFWDRGKVNGGFHDFCFLEFPFDVSMLTAAGWDTATDPQPPTDSKPPESRPRTADPPLDSVPLQPQAGAAAPEEPQPQADTTLLAPFPPPQINAAPPVGPPPSSQEAARNLGTIPKPRRYWRAVRLAFTVVLLALAGIAAGIFLSQKLAWIGRNAEPTPIALKVERQGMDLSVTWNHNSPLVTGADAGRLTIYDGSAREFPLDKNQIRSGSVVYSPVTDQVRVQLDLQTPDQRITSESVMVVLNRPGTTDSSVVVQPMQAQRPFPPAPFAAREAGAPPGTTPASAKVRPRREFLPPQERAAAQTQPPELAPPPPVTAMNPAPAAVPAPALPLPHSQPPPAPKASSTANTSAQPQAPSRPSERLTLIGASDYIPPVPIRQPVPPPLTPAQRSFISRTTVVEIKVFVDASGNVLKTEPLTHANPALTTVAQSTAKLWTFHPARKAGQNVPSEMVLRFKFDLTK